MGLKIFIGYDKDETVAFHVLANSIMRQASQPVQIMPLVLSQLFITRPRDPVQTSDFTFTRFLVPWLCGYKGQALYLDCDMLVRCDIAEVFKAADPAAQISVVKHDYIPKDAEKFLGHEQTRYERKNWSSMMVFNCDQCAGLTQEVVNTAPSDYLRGLQWADRIGGLPAEYNHLVGEYPPNPGAKIVHFTVGTPCFAKYARCEYAQEWRDELKLTVYYNRNGEFSLPERAET